MVTLNNEELKVVNSFVYLGFLLDYSGKFQSIQKRVAQQGGRALSSLLNILKTLYLSHQKRDMFDSLITSVLCYAAEIWEFHYANEVEQTHY